MGRNVRGRPVRRAAGSSAEIYRGIPTAALLFAAPIMGALFVMFLPFIGIALLLQHITRAAIEAAGDVIERVLRSVSPTWRPGMAFLAGKARRTRHAEKAATNPELEALEKEIEERRKIDIMRLKRASGFRLRAPISSPEFTPSAQPSANAA